MRSTRCYAAAPTRRYFEPVQPGPDGPVVLHAKEPGERLTLCGISADSWPLSWELPFDPDEAWACHDCASLISSDASGSPEGQTAATSSTVDPQPLDESE